MYGSSSLRRELELFAQNERPEIYRGRTRLSAASTYFNFQTIFQVKEQGYTSRTCRVPYDSNCALT